MRKWAATLVGSEVGRVAGEVIRHACPRPDRTVSVLGATRITLRVITHTLAKGSTYMSLRTSDCDWVITLLFFLLYKEKSRLIGLERFYLAGVLANAHFYAVFLFMMKLAGSLA